jgi:hypothetical protein
MLPDCVLAWGSACIGDFLPGRSIHGTPSEGAMGLRLFQEPDALKGEATRLGLRLATDLAK